MRWTMTLAAWLWLFYAHAIPETVVLMPVATLNTPRSLYLATEQYGVPRLYAQTQTRCAYTQFMLTERFDLGVDFVGVDQPQNRQVLFNARYVLTPETTGTPGVALGVWNVANDTAPTHYATVMRTTSLGRFHFGGYTSEGRWGWSSAYQFSLAGFDGAVEYFRLPSGDTYTSFGIGRALNQSVYLYTYYSRHDKTRDADLFGVYISFTPFRIF